MSYWSIVFIIMAIAMVVGPIMIMKPSHRDRRLANLRQRAASLGLQVRVSDYDGCSIAVYSLPVNLPKTIASWQLLKKSYSHGIHFYQKWQLLESSGAIPKNIEAALKFYIDELSDEIVSLEVNRTTIGIGWLEKSNANVETVEKIQSKLKKLFQLIS